MTARPTTVSIATDQVDVWFADLDAAATENDRWYDLLSADELERADKLRAMVDRQRFVTARGILRTLLGRALSIAPESISFSYGAYGKPALSGYGLHFNLSHSHGRALFAFSSRSPIGVDLELVRTLPDFVQVGESIFSPVEVKEFERIAGQDQPSAFFKCWTRKEALIKALGTGLSYPLQEFSVSFDEPARLLSDEGGRTDLTRWHISHFEPEPGYFAAIATQQGESRIVVQRFVPETQSSVK